MRNDWDILVQRRWWMSRADIDVLYYRWKSGQIQQVEDGEMLREFQAVRAEELRIEAAENLEPQVFMFGGVLDAMFGKTPNGQK